MVRVGIFMGGKSIEREVSFNSGRTIYDHFDTTRYKPVPIFQRHDGKLFILPLRFIHRGKISDFEHRLEQEAASIAWDDLPSLIDFAFLVMHGRYAEDGTLQGMLELIGIPYLGSKVFGSALTMDKIALKKILRVHDIPVPQDVIVQPNQISAEQLPHITQEMKDQDITYPCIVKPHKEGSSLGVAVVFNETELLPALHAAAYINQGIAQPVLIEEKIQGVEFTCITLLNKGRDPIFLPITEVEYEAGSHFYTYEQKYMPGRAIKYTPARIS